jgi:O-antigen/teichoic acid export membrane protein
MFNKIKHSFKQTAIYSIGNLSTKLIGLVLLPLFTEYLTTSEYGVLAILEVTSQIMIGVLALNLPLAMLRWASSEKDTIQQKSIVFTTIVAIVLIIAFQLLLLLPNTKYFSQLLFSSNHYSDYFLYLFITVAFGIYNGIPLNLIRVKEKAIHFIIVSAIKFTTILALNIYLIAFLNMGVKGIVISQLVGEIVLFIITIPLISKNIVIKFDVNSFQEMLKYGFPLILSTVSTYAFSFGDRYILKYYLNDASVGIYAMGYKIAGIINMLVLQSFQLGFLPIAYKKLGDKDEGRFFSKILTYYSLLLVFVALLISFFSKELLQILAQREDYWIAYTVVPIIAFSFVLKGIQYTFALSFHYSKKTSYNAIIVLLTAVINLSLNIILIQKIGYLGAAYSMFISVLFMLLVSYHFGNKVYPIPYELKKIFLVVIVGILFYFISILFNSFSLIYSLILKMTLMIAFPFLLYTLNFFEQVELKRISSEWQKWKNPLQWLKNFKDINL